MSSRLGWRLMPVGTVGAMAFPRFAGKHGHEELVSPAVMRDWRQGRGLLPDRVPESMILLYQGGLYTSVVGLESTSPLGGQGMYQKAVALDRTSGRVGVIGGFGIGAPAAAVVLEDLIVLGVERFLSIGTAGGLQPDLVPGDVVVCTSAVRDEGVSHHYAAPEAPAQPDSVLTDALESAIAAAELPSRRGCSWTIDTPYRETATEARHYQNQGVVFVEMEAAALFTVAHHRGVALASAFCVSDSIAGDEWDPLFDHPDLAHNLWLLYGAAVDALSG